MLLRSSSPPVVGLEQWRESLSSGHDSPYRCKSHHRDYDCRGSGRGRGSKCQDRNLFHGNHRGPNSVASVAITCKVYDLPLSQHAL